MRIVDFPYGRPSKTLRNAVTWLNRNRIRLIKECIARGENIFMGNDFAGNLDYPNY